MTLHRNALVEYTLLNGIKPVTREFQTTIKTLRKRVSRFRVERRPGLRDLSTRP